MRDWPLDENSAIRVLYVHHAGAVGGASNSLRYLIQSFPAGTVEPYVLCPPGTALEAFRKAGIQTTPISGVSLFGSAPGIPLRGLRLITLLRDLRYMANGRLILRTIEHFRPDVVHLNERSMLHTAFLAKNAGLPVVMHARLPSERDTRWVHDWGVRLTNKYVDMLIAIDESVRNSLREVKRCKVVYNPLRLDERDCRPADNSDQSELDSSEKVTRVTYLSWLQVQKGVWDLLLAAARLKHRQDIRFQFAGTNSRPRKFHESLFGRACRQLDLVQDMETRMQDFIDQEGLHSTVTLLGHVSDVNDLFHNTEILAFPSHLNGPSRSVFEAGVYGIPSIVALRDRVQDIVEDGVTGLVIPEKDPTALATAIEMLADDSKLRTQLGANARLRYLKLFDPRRSAREVLDIYRALVSV